MKQVKMTKLTQTDMKFLESHGYEIVNIISKNEYFVVTIKKIK